MKLQVIGPKNSRNKAEILIFIRENGESLELYKGQILEIEKDITKEEAMKLKDTTWEVREVVK